ncbi:uncharacterized protein [Argopecten irradians]|uniref:uncharacterized protein n=1 Tax=Argopecten irradians TaxID=31199 RepID=UPI0037182792
MMNQTCPQTPFPKIKGPRCKHDKIAIIGAGPSGIHMAYRLKEEGYTRVTVFEKNNYIGGKSRTINYRETPHDMGTVYTQPDYTEIYKLVEKFNAGDLLPMPQPDVWVDENNPTFITSLQNSIRILQGLRPNVTTVTGPSIVIDATLRYIGLHRAMFGDYRGMMPRPCPAVLSQINMTFGEFLTSNNLDALRGLFFSIQTIQGYGKVDEISALYGLIWVTPNFLAQVLVPALPSERKVKILSKGFQFLWEEIARQNKLNVRLSSPVRNVVRLSKKKGFYVAYKDKHGICGERFDFLITTPEMSTMTDVIKFDAQTQEMFLKSFHYYYTTTLADADFGIKGANPQDYYYYNVEKGDESVWASRDSYSSLNLLIDGNYTVPNPGGQQLKTSVYYQLTEGKPKRQTLTRKLRQHVLSTEKASNFKIIKRIRWPYFPRYSVSDMATGILWDIFDRQGLHNIWYIGSSVYFESVMNIVEYNNLLLKQFLQ